MDVKNWRKFFLMMAGGDHGGRQSIKSSAETVDGTIPKRNKYHVAKVHESRTMNLKRIMTYLWGQQDAVSIAMTIARHCY
jgi:hypothetical protein